jgi:hypothetical protein
MGFTPEMKVSSPEMSVSPPEHGLIHNAGEAGAYPQQQVFDFRSAPQAFGQSSHGATANMNFKPAATDGDSRNGKYKSPDPTQRKIGELMDDIA